MSPNPLQTPVRVLCCMTHYHGGEDRDTGRAQPKSAYQDQSTRRGFVETALQSLRDLGELPEVSAVDVRVCGKKDRCLVPLDVEFDPQDPKYLIFDTLAYMLRHREDYDYFIMVEDDIVVPGQVLQNAIRFDAESMPNEVLHPNRLEELDGERYNTDLKSRGHWTSQHRFLDGRMVCVNTNPHSAIFVLSREKFAYCAEHADIDFRGVFRVGEFAGGPMASAFANFLCRSSLYRPVDDLDYHYVLHQDPFIPYERSLGLRIKAGLYSLLPPALLSALRGLKRRLTGSGGA